MKIGKPIQSEIECFDFLRDLERNNATKNSATPTAVTTRLPPGRNGIVVYHSKTTDSMLTQPSEQSNIQAPDFSSSFVNSKLKLSVDFHFEYFPIYLVQSEIPDDSFLHLDIIENNCDV